ncbi:MAG: (Na+)-NQR maturation NqrM [Zoogloeaceae bacterium]|nr:(Na+)-NQR maturation NqrM [Zoogloeaceae bacterium]
MLFSFIVFLVLIMAIGVLSGRKPIAGSCGGYETLHIACAAGEQRRGRKGR